MTTIKEMKTLSFDGGTTIYEITDSSALHDSDVVSTYSVSGTSPVNGTAVASALSNSGFITGIDSTDVTTALGFTPYNSTNPSGYITSSALTPYALNAPNINVLSTSGTIALTDNSLNSITPSGNITFTLPAITDNTVFHQILVQINLSTVYTIDIGTTYFFDKTAPDMSNADVYNLIYEYDKANQYWVAGVLSKGASA